MKKIKLEKGHENDASLYIRIVENRRLLKIIESGYVNIGEYTHHKKKGLRGWDLYNNLHNVL